MVAIKIIITFDELMMMLLMMFNLNRWLDDYKAIHFHSQWTAQHRSQWVHSAYTYKLTPLTKRQWWWWWWW